MADKRQEKKLKNYLSVLQAVFLAVFVLLNVFAYNTNITLSPPFLPWFGKFAMNVIFIILSGSALLALFYLINDKILEFERSADDSVESAKIYEKTNTELKKRIDVLGEKIGELSTLQRVVHVMNQTMILEKILKIIIDSMCRYLSYTRAVILLVDEQKDEIKPGYSEGVDEEKLKDSSISLKDKDNIIVKAIFERLPKIINVPDGKVHPVFMGFEGGKGMFAIVPLEARDRVIGVMVAGDTKNKRALQEKDLRALLTFANQAAVAIENARLYETEKNFKEELQRRVDSAVEKLKQTQNQLIQSEKLAALGQMSAVVTHEVRNPLSTIRGSAEIIARKLKDDKSLGKFPEFIIREVERLDRVVTEILTFSRKPQLVLNMSDVNKIISDTVASMDTGDFAGKNIKYIVGLDRNIPEILIDRDQIKQVILNIIQNACHFLENSAIKRLEIKTKNENKRVIVSIADTGPGILPENLARIFEPFFTAKVRGTGLGLSICKNIIESHRGSIKVNSKQNQGTEFIITLPKSIS